MKNLYQKIIKFFTRQTIPNFDFILKEQESIYEQVVLFAETIAPEEKIIVSKKDFLEIVMSKINYNCYMVDCQSDGIYIGRHKLEIESINICPRIELGEKRTNRNFELK